MTRRKARGFLFHLERAGLGLGVFMPRGVFFLIGANPELMPELIIEMVSVGFFSGAERDTICYRQV